MVQKAHFRSWSLDHPRRQAFLIAQDESFSQQAFISDDARASPNAVANKVYNTITQRMRSQHLDPAYVTLGSINFLVENVEEHKDILLQVLKDHSVVSDEMLIMALDLKESTAEDIQFNEDDVGKTLYYVRSWPLLVSDLYELVAKIEEDGLFPEEIHHWLAPFILMPEASREETTCYIRYVGKCTYPEVPFKRFIADLKRESGILSLFTSMLEQHFPDSYAAGRTFQFVNATIDPYATDLAKDNRERAIIAFFNLDKLLNQQPGGVYASYVPLQNDAALFQRLGTRLWRNFYNTAAPSRLAPTLQDQWIKLIDEITSEHPVETRTATHPMNEALLEMLLEQGTPRLINGHCLSVMIGKDITKEDYLGLNTFLSGKSRAGHIVRDFLARYESYELNRNFWDAALAQTGMFPFVDLFPWPSLQPVDEGLRQLRSYLNITRPLLTVTFSHKVSSCAFANFYHEYGITFMDDYLTYVGMPTVRHYAPPEWLNDSDTNHEAAGFSTIVVPLYHPGYDKYGSQPVELRRVFDLSFMVAIFVANALVTECTAADQAGDHDELVANVFAQVNPAAIATLDANLQALYRELDAAKDALREYVRQERARMPQIPTRDPIFMTELTRMRATEAAKQRVERNLYAEGAIESVERNEQVDYLWKMQFPDLLMMAAPGDTQERQFKEWARQLPEGTSFFGSALARAPRVRGVDVMRNILMPFAPADAQDDTWLQDEALRQEAIDAKVRQLMAGLPADHFSSEKQRERRLNALQMLEVDRVYHQHLNGTEIHVSGNGTVTLRWLRPENNERVLIRFRVAQSLKSTLPGDKRFIFFVDEGIALKDEMDRWMTIGKRRAATTVIVKAETMDLSSPELRECWQYERARVTGQQPQVVVAGPVAVTVAPGRAPFKSTAKSEEMQAFTLPINEADGLWLLHQFLLEHFPEGGVFNMADPERYSTKTDLLESSFRVLFPRFLERYAWHLYANHWMIWMRQFATVGAKHVYANIRFLRPDAVKTNPYRKDDAGKNARVIFFEMGPAMLRL
ncbi:hypothetical protein HDU85_002675 [Gaertneriomyces sp. JEL0708]|nr:hypothetical protein HDU85_002675 [Gaertneriomyces sp. JEL0708]